MFIFVFSRLIVALYTMLSDRHFPPNGQVFTPVQLHIFVSVGGGGERSFAFLAGMTELMLGVHL